MFGQCPLVLQTFAAHLAHDHVLVRVAFDVFLEHAHLLKAHGTCDPGHHVRGIMRLLHVVVPRSFLNERFLTGSTNVRQLCIIRITRISGDFDAFCFWGPYEWEDLCAVLTAFMYEPQVLSKLQWTEKLDFW